MEDCLSGFDVLKRTVVETTRNIKSENIPTVLTDPFNMFVITLREKYPGVLDFKLDSEYR